MKIEILGKDQTSFILIQKHKESVAFTKNNIKMLYNIQD
jgi:hypothetical protein